MFRQTLMALALLASPQGIPGLSTAQANDVDWSGRRLVSPGRRRGPSSAKNEQRRDRSRAARAKERTRAALAARRLSFDFVETPLPDILSFLSDLSDSSDLSDGSEESERSGVSFSLDRSRVPDPPRITLKLNDVALRSALHWLCRLAHLDYVVGERHVVLTTPEGVYLLDDKPIRIYHVAELTRPTLLRRGRRRTPSGNTGPELAELVRRTIEPGTWGAKYGTSVTYRAGLLTVVHIGRVHKKVATLLAGLR